MKKSRFSEEQIIGVLREAQAGSAVKAVCAAHNISTATYHAWKRKYGGMEVNEARRLRALEEEKARRAMDQLRAREEVLRFIVFGFRRGTISDSEEFWVAELLAH